MNTAGLFTKMTKWAKPKPLPPVSDYRLAHPWIPLLGLLVHIIAWEMYLLVAFYALAVMLQVWTFQALVWCTRRAYRYIQQRQAAKALTT